MQRHFVFTINPNGQYDWDKLNLSCPLGNTPNLPELLSEIATQPGTHLIRVCVEVEIIQTEPIAPTEAIAPVETNGHTAEFIH